MSFHIEFYAEHSVHAKGLVDEANLPTPVRQFIAQALDGCEGNPVYVKAYGHLYTGDYKISTATIVVQPIPMSVPKGEPASK